MNTDPKEKERLSGQPNVPGGTPDISGVTNFPEESIPGIQQVGENIAVNITKETAPFITASENTTPEAGKNLGDTEIKLPGQNTPTVDGSGVRLPQKNIAQQPLASQPEISAVNTVTISWGPENTFWNASVFQRKLEERRKREQSLASKNNQQGGLQRAA